MKKYWQILIGFIIIISIFSLTMILMKVYSIGDKDFFVAKGGVLQLSDVDLKENKIILLKGEWEFYYNKLLEPQDFIKNNTGTSDIIGYIKVPSFWNEMTNGKKINGKGCGTYRLRIKLKPSTNIYGIKISSIILSNKIYINGILRSQSGIPADEKSKYEPSNVPKSFFFNVDDETIDIIIQVANFDYPTGGIFDNVYFGLQDNIYLLDSLHNILELSGAVVLFLFGIYQLGIYSMQMKEKSFLYSGLLFLMLAIAIVSYGEKLVIKNFKGMRFILALKVEDIVLPICMIYLVLFLKENNDELISNNEIKVVYYLVGLYVMLIIFLPIRLYSYIKPGIIVIIFLFVVFLFYRILTGYMQGRFGKLDKKGSFFLTLALFFLLLVEVNGFLYYINYIRAYLAIIVCGMGFIVSIALFLAYRFIFAHNRAEVLCYQLLQIDKLKEEFFINASYELRTPLYEIINMSESIIDACARCLKTDLRKNILLINKIALKLYSYINDVLDFTKCKNKSFSSVITTSKENKSNVLIIDDEKACIELAKNILTEEGYKAWYAFTEEEAVSLMKHNKIDLILIDIMMHKGQGIKICRNFRKRFSLVELPILITANKKEFENQFILGIEAGANDFITKPFERQEFIIRTKTMISMKTANENAYKNEMAFLQAQIKPHFLYNTISIIISFCYTDASKAAKLLTDFSQYLRLNFEIDNNVTSVSLERELELVKAYIKVEKARFGKRIKVHYNIEKDLLSMKIPPLIIQPLVENAIRHGICKKEEGGTVKIIVKRIQTKLCIMIKDNGVGISKEKLDKLKDSMYTTNGIGFINIKKRISKLEGADLIIESKEGRGTKIIILL